MAKRSNNAYYRSPDITGIINNLSTAMGLSGNADSNYLTNLNKMGRLEGITLDNTKKQGIADLLKKAIAPYVETDPTRAYGLSTATGYGDVGLGETRFKTLPALVARGESEAAGAKSKAGVEGLLAGLAEQIGKHGMRPDPAEFEGGPAGGRHLYDDAIAGATKNFEDLVRKYRAIGGKGDAQKTAQQQEALVQSDIGVEETQRQYNRARIAAVGKTNEAQIREIEGRISSLRGLTTLRKKEITNRILDNIARLDQDILDSKKGRELLDKKVLYWVEQELTAKERTATQSLVKEQEQLQLEELPTTLSFKRERLRQLKRRASELAEQAELDTLARPRLLELQTEIAELDKDIKTAGKGKAEAQKDRAITLSDMSTMEKNALPEHILKKAQELEVKIRKGEQEIKLAEARTGDVNRASGIKIMQKAHWNNKLNLQKLLSPHLQKYHKERAANEAGKFAQQTALKMIPPVKAKKPLEPKGGIDNWFFEGGKDDVPNMPAEPYNNMYGDIMELAETGKLKNIDVKNAQGISPKTQILKAMIQQLGINKNQATQVLEQWLEELTPEGG